MRTGAASSNSDGQVHVQTLASANGQQTIGFEDLYGGGDRDFNDAIIPIGASYFVRLVQRWLV